MARGLLLPSLFVIIIGVSGCDSGSSASNVAPPAGRVASSGVSITASYEGPAWVSYQSSPRGLDGLFLVHEDGSHDHEIATSLPGQHIHPDWSSDGRSLVFRADIGDHPQLFLFDPVADPAGRQALQLTHCANTCVQVDDPALSPDGSHLAYVEDTGTTVVGQLEVPASFDLQVARITDRGLADVHTLVHSRTGTSGPTELLEPRWSPDGRTLVFWSNHTDPSTTAVDGTVISTVRSDGSHQRALTPPSMFAGEVDWSPDGRGLAFVTHPLIVFNFDEVISNLFTCRPDGSDVRQLTFASTSHDRATQARWTPDGRILYTRSAPDSRTLWVRDANGSHAGPIAPGEFATHGDLQPALPR